MACERGILQAGASTGCEGVAQVRSARGQTFGNGCHHAWYEQCPCTQQQGAGPECATYSPRLQPVTIVPLPLSLLCWLSPRHGAQHGTAWLRGHPNSPASPPLAATRRMPSARCPLQAEDTGTQDSNVTLAAGAGNGVGWEGTSPPRPAGTPCPGDRAQRAQGAADTVPEGHGLWGRRSKALPSATSAGSSGSRGAAPGGGRGRGPTRSPERRCYIYCMRAWVSASRV